MTKLKAEIDQATITVGGCSTPFSETDKTIRQKTKTVKKWSI